MLAVAELVASPAVAAGEHHVAAEAASVTGEAVVAAAVVRAASLAVVADAVAPVGSRGAVAVVDSVEDADGEVVVSAGVDGASEHRTCVGHFLRVMVFLGQVWLCDGVKGVIVHLGVTDSHHGIKIAMDMLCVC